VPLLKKSSAARIVNVSSSAHKFEKIHLNNINLRNGDYHPFFAYGQSKLANVLFSRELAKRLRHTYINTYSLHPGVIDTDLSRHVGETDDKLKGKGFMGFLRRNLCLTPFMGSQTTLYCALEEDLDDETGYYYEYVLYYLICFLQIINWYLNWQQLSANWLYDTRSQWRQDRQSSLETEWRLSQTWRSSQDLIHKHLHKMRFSWNFVFANIIILVDWQTFINK